VLSLTALARASGWLKNIPEYFFFLFSLLDRKLTGRSVLIMFRERWNVIKY
jgi:hypothetical protein